jgi:23S rRNA (cytosine1962-C5)-methyltransferase
MIPALEFEPLLSELQRNLQGAGGDACRLFHGRGRTFAGFQHVAIDYFHPVLLVTLFTAVDKDWLQALGSELMAIVEPAGVTAVVVQERQAEGAPLTLLWGELPHKLTAIEAGLRYGIQLGGRQNLGFFLDMSAARQWLSGRARDKRILNLFAYTCAFSVVARAAGARQVVNLDMSASALRQGQQNHQRNGILDGAQFLAHDLFKSWAKLRRLAPFDLIIVDPPSRQPGSFVAERDYGRVLQKLPALCADNAELLICLNSPHLETSFLREQVATHAPQLSWQERLANPAAFVDENPELSLKVLSYRCALQGDSESR